MTSEIEKDTRPVFVFGSNLQGIHRSGAAKDAMEKYGAIFGQGEGIQGNCYALPTKRTPWVSLSLDEIREHVGVFLEYATKNSTTQFNVTKVGCGLAGYSSKDIAPMFYAAPENCWMHRDWLDIHEQMDEISGSTKPDFKV